MRNELNSLNSLNIDKTYFLVSKMFLFIALLILHQPAEGDTSPITCYNDNGEAVDWYYLYKLPNQKGSKDPARGLRYLLLEKGSEGWTEGKFNANSSAGAPGRTVGQLYGGHKNQEVAYILYNDQPHKPTPGLRNSENTKGHTKGVVLLDKTQGFWLVHSTPKFPPPRADGQYSYPATGMKKGQSFLCVTYPLKHFQTIGEQLLINQPTVYDCDVPPSLATAVPALLTLCKQSMPALQVFPQVKPMTNRSVILTSLDGTDFLNFAKGSAFNNDLYSSWVAPTLQSHLLVRFWVCAKGHLPSSCTGPWKVLDVSVVNPGHTANINASADHSKWAVSTQAPGSGSGSGSRGVGGWVCVGDINRIQAEEKRGGGTVCQQNPVVWKAYRSSALSCMDCSNGTMCDAADVNG
ncbi:deoxyribonuclease-2-alpha isoform X1 [Gadus macrocephalus]|uniref:deoxyribonuclease-2-alpha isoform X1 n=2 Tax=Gadus macrocephalus TaxID=80720 RepID=UPI0028CB26FF|nr:deoxyribonuclease-2-alpha isoform X1 [Gadus macrocephalus]